MFNVTNISFLCCDWLKRVKSSMLLYRFFVLIGGKGLSLQCDFIASLS